MAELKKCDCEVCHPGESVETKKEYVDWHGLDKYTIEFKEWILKLFRKVHARIGHVEEELAHAKKDLRVDYSLNKIADGDTLTYTLVENVTGSEKGSIVITSEGFNIRTWESDGDL